MYRDGKSVEQDHIEAAMWFRKSAEAGYVNAQFNLGIIYCKGQGVEQNFSEAARWVQLAAVHGSKGALEGLDLLHVLQQHNPILTLHPGTAVTTILLTSANAAKYNNKTGRAVKPVEGASIKPGCVAVLFDGEAAPISFK